MFRNSKIQAIKVVLNHLMRNIDLEMSLLEGELHTENPHKSEALLHFAPQTRMQTTQ
jgi:hypothetical protein